MHKELLCFKYDRIPVSTNYSSKNLIQLGWKCRKYQRWEQVHEGDECRRKLKNFGDAAIDEETFRFDIFPTVNAVLLNVERWRLDKKNLSVEPSHYESWDHADIVMKTCQARPSASLNYLHEYYDLSDGLNFERAYDYVGKHMLLLILKESLDIELEVELIDLDQTIPELVGLLFKDLEMPHEVGRLIESESVQEMLKLLDLPYKKFTVTEKDVSDWEPEVKTQMVWAERALEGFVTAKMVRIKGDDSIYFNTNNSCFKFAQKSLDTDEMYKKMIEANISALEDLSLKSDLITDIQEMWGLKLDRLFRDRTQ